jgi:hypothetical protein
MSSSMHVFSCCDVRVARCRHSSKAGSVKKMYLLNRDVVHFIDDIFWKMGFKTETEAEKVITRIITIIFS